MQTLMQIEQTADRLTSQLFDSSIHNRDNKKQHLSRIESLTEEYMDDKEQIWDVLLSEEYVDFEAVQEVLRAGVLALKYNPSSFDAFARSFFQMLTDGVDKKAERDA